jgi:lysozyme family protein
VNFDRAFEVVVGHEGGYVNDPRDPGGETKFGISKRAYPEIDISAITLEEAKAIYLRDYWQRMRCDEMPEVIRYPLFDAAVNSGVGKAAKWLQTVLNVTPDGVIGAVTVAAARTSHAEAVARQMLGLRLDFMTHLPTWPTFSAGWARRIAAILMEA